MGNSRHHASHHHEPGARNLRLAVLISFAAHLLLLLSAAQPIAQQHGAMGQPLAARIINTTTTRPPAQERTTAAQGSKQKPSRSPPSIAAKHASSSEASEPGLDDNSPDLVAYRLQVAMQIPKGALAQLTASTRHEGTVIIELSKSSGDHSRPRLQRIKSSGSPEIDELVIALVENSLQQTTPPAKLQSQAFKLTLQFDFGP